MLQQLSRYDTACRALAEARTVDEVRDIINKSEAIREYARRAKNRQLEVDATEIRLRAERRYGEMLRDLRTMGQIADGRPKKTVNCGGPFRVTLDDLDTSKNFSSKCQRLAEVSNERFEHMVVQWRGKALAHDERITFDLFAREKAERRAIREVELGRRQCALPQRRYGVIVADPEWRFEPWSRETGMDRAADNHYPTSSLDMIKARDVASIAADDCALGLWGTVPMLPQALDVMVVWGFTYRTCWCWAKDRIGPGYWNRNKHELFLFGTRGEVPCPAPGEQWDSLLEAPRRGHSEKPEIFLEMMEAYFPHLPKIELNRRGTPRPGWDAWGYEAQQEAVA
jgi:N6-adenosine-specific RNA methylase IME4